MKWTARLAFPADFEGWRSAARRCLSAELPPKDVAWHIESEAEDLFQIEVPPPPDATVKPVVNVPSQFLELARKIVCHSDPGRFDLAYRLLWRLRAEPHLLSVASDFDVHRARKMQQAVSRDMHKMKAFLRFREAHDAAGRIFLAWFEPAHHILDAVSPFFVRRFANERWAILTPGRSAHWDGGTLTVKPSEATRRNIPDADALEDYWRTYFASIFNPARLKVGAMQSEMPKKYWRNLPEASLIAPLIATAQNRMSDMIAKAPTAPSKRSWRAIPNRVSEETMVEGAALERLRAEAAHCRACPLWERATQTVFGAGPPDARLMLVGEQPGDQEDLAGEPFVGPAGEVLNRAMTDAGIDRGLVYVTNAVKHFKFTPRGKRRLHQKPDLSEIAACRRWLDAERKLLKPRIIVALGATAARSLLNRPVRLLAERGQPIPGENGEAIFLTVHPSYLLRLPDPAAKREQYSLFVRDLMAARAAWSADPPAQ